eukprot:5005081-Prymnesium_polylepis.2
MRRARSMPGSCSRAIALLMALFRRSSKVTRCRSLERGDIGPATASSSSSGLAAALSSSVVVAIDVESDEVESDEEQEDCSRSRDCRVSPSGVSCSVDARWSGTTSSKSSRESSADIVRQAL